MNIKEFCDLAISNGMFTFDVEHLPDLSRYQPNFNLIGTSFATGDVSFFEKDTKSALQILHRLFDTDTEAIAWNGKYDLQCLRAVGLKSDPVKFVDPMVALNLLDDNRTPHDLGLKKATLDLFGHQMVNFKDAYEYGPDSKEFEDYAIEDAVWELKAWQKLKPDLIKNGLIKIFERILMPAAIVFSDMEMFGVGWDLEGAKRLLRGFQSLRSQMEAEVYQEIGRVNIDSGDQLSTRLFDELGYSTRGIDKTNSGRRWSVDVRAMNVLAKRYPVCDKIRAYRTATKMIGTYIEPLTRMHMDDPRGRVHPTYWLVSSTGRTRCEKPNFQNIPKWITKRPGFENLSIRGNVVPTEGRKLVIADFSQVELRLVAHISNDKKFINAYTAYRCKECNNEGNSDVILHRCPHCDCFEDETNGFWHGLDIHQQTCDLVPALGGDRQKGKTANFALVYYATAFRLAYEYPVFDRVKWQAVIDQYFDRRSGYAGVAKWHQKMRAVLWSTGEARDIFGRRRRIPKAHIDRNAKHALNQLINFAPQASACGMMLLAMKKIKEHFKEEKLWMNGVYPQNMVHDEVVLEVEPQYVDQAVAATRQAMEHCVQLKVPIRADIDVSSRWVEDDEG